MSTKTKEKRSMAPFKQCTMHLKTETGHQVHVAWIPAELARVGKHVLIDGMPGRWKVVEAGPAQPEWKVLAYNENARRGFPSVTGHEESK